MNNNQNNLKPVDSDYVKFLIDKEKNSRPPAIIRQVADVFLFLGTLGFAIILIGTMTGILFFPVIILFMPIMNLPFPGAQLILLAFMIFSLLGYRFAEKWAFFSIGTLYTINVGLWAFAAYQGATLEFGKLALLSIMPITILVIGTLNWKHFS